MYHTMQAGYELVRREVKTDDTPLDGSTEGLTYKLEDMPSVAKSLGPEANICEILFCCYGAENSSFSFKIYSYSVTGPAEFVCAGTGLLGTASSNGRGCTFCDSITFTDISNWLDTPVAVDNANNRICRVCFDLFGTKHLYIEITDVGGGGQAIGVEPFIRFL